MTVSYPRTIHVELSPGDMTRYEFLISDLGKNIAVTCLNSFRFDGYFYDLGSVEDFFLRNGNPPPEKESYRSWAGPLLSDPYVSYMVTHSSCNPWTAIAALICARMLWTAE